MRDATLDAHVEAVKQVAVADRIVLTKADLVDDPDDARRRCARGCAQLNPGAAILDAGDSRPASAALFECGLYDPATKTADVRALAGRGGAITRRRIITIITTTIMPSITMTTITRPSRCARADPVARP